MTDRELMQQALDALEVATTPLAKDRQEVLRAQAALRERLAQPLVSTDGTSTWIDIPQRPVTPREMQPCAGRNCGSINPNLHSAECFEDYEKSTGLAQPEQEPVAHTTGHCENHKQKGGCQLHNLQCGWPDCDRKPITTSLQSRSEQAQWDAIPDAFNEWWDADYDDTGNPYRKDSPAYWAWSGWKAASKQPEQEPVAWLYRDLWGVMKLSQTMPPPVGAFPVYTAPPQRTWVGLTDEEIEQGCKESWVTEQAFQSAVWWAEAKLKEKNHDLL